MGLFDLYCPLCGMPFYNGELKNCDYIKKNKYKLSDIKWLLKVTLLLPNKKSKSNFKVIPEDPTTFINSKTKEKYNIQKNEGLPLHTDCYKLAKKAYDDYNLNFFSFNKKNIKGDWIYYTFKNLNYKPVSKYWTQFFPDSDKFIKDKNEYIVYSPFSKNNLSKKNTKRILNNIKIIYKNDKNKKNDKDIKKRPSPSDSATIYKIGYKKKGNDGNIWIIIKTKNNVKKWKKINKKN